MNPLKASGEHATTYDTRTVRLSEDVPGAYTLMFTQFVGKGNKALGRCGYGGKHTLATRLSSGKKRAYHDPLKLLMEEDFTGPDSVIDEFIKSVMWRDEAFDALVDGGVYEVEDMEEMLDGPGG
jgi:hypothetical protein